jgi:hypothetical protein
MTITLRPTLSVEDEFLFSVYACTRAEEMDLVDWDSAQKEAFLRMQFHAQRQQYQLSDPDAINQIIEFNGVPAGRWMVPRGSPERSVAGPVRSNVSASA